MLTESTYHGWWPSTKADIMKLGAWSVTNSDFPKLAQPSRPPDLAADADVAAASAFTARLSAFRTDECEYKEWITLDQKAQGIILDAVSAPILQAIATLDSAKALWDKLKEDYEALSHCSLEEFYIQADIFSKRYVPGESIQNHVNFMRMQNSRLGAKAFNDKLLAMLLLHSLPNDRDVAGPYASLIYQLVTSIVPSTTFVAGTSTTKGTTLITTPGKLPSATVEARLLDFARLDCRTTSTTETAAAASAQRGRPRTGSGKRAEGKHCAYMPCQKAGHVEVDCYMKKRHADADAAAQAKRSTDRKDGRASAHAASHASEHTSDSDSSDGPRLSRTLRVKAAVAHAAFAERAAHEREWDNPAGRHHCFLAALVFALLVKTLREHMILDSGCLRHLSPRRDWFNTTTYKPLATPINIHLGDTLIIRAVGEGSIHMLMHVGNNQVILVMFPHVLHVPDLASTLISVLVLTKRGHLIEFKADHCLVRTPKPNRRVVCSTYATKGGLYLLDGKPTRSSEYALAAASSRTVDINILHRRLGHLNFDDIKRLVGKGMVEGVDSVGGRQEFCKHCVMAKAHRLPFPLSGKRARHILNLIHSDVCGPFPASIGGACYCVTFIDNHSRCLWLFPIHYKSDVFAIFKTFKSMVELQTGRLIKAFQTDNGGKYMLAAFCAFLVTHGIIRRTTVAYSPKQNGLAEQCNRTIVERIWTMLLDGNLSSSFWAEAAKTAAYLINISPATKLGGQTPREAFTNEKPWIAALHPFGCPAYAHIPKEKRKKLDTKTQKCVMIGYEPGSKAYCLWNPSTRTIIKARDVIFDERNLKSDAVIRIDLTDFPLAWHGQHAWRQSRYERELARQERVTQQHFLPTCKASGSEQHRRCTV
jgi:transposase InsO family protein